MKITLPGMSDKDSVRIAIQAESEAEEHQLNFISDELIKAGVFWLSYHTEDGERGITFGAKKKT